MSSKPLIPSDLSLLLYFRYNPRTPNHFLIVALHFLYVIAIILALYFLPTSHSHPKLHSTFISPFFYSLNCITHFSPCLLSYSHSHSLSSNLYLFKYSPNPFENLILLYFNYHFYLNLQYFFMNSQINLKKQNFIFIDFAFSIKASFILDQRSNQSLLNSQSNFLNYFLLLNSYFLLKKNLNYFFIRKKNKT